MLNEELQRAGLELNAKKSRIFTLEEEDLYGNASEILVDTAGDSINIVRSTECHTYLGNRFPGDLKVRGRVILANRLRCAWAKFNQFRHALTNKHVDLALRMRLFDSVVTPTALYGLSTAPLTAQDTEKLASTQLHMLRCMAGYVKLESDDWSDMYRRLKIKIGAAMIRRPIRQWATTEISICKGRLQNKLRRPNRHTLLDAVVAWNPSVILDAKLLVQPKRCRGRPRTMWNRVAA